MQQIVSCSSLWLDRQPEFESKHDVDTKSSPSRSYAESDYMRVTTAAAEPATVGKESENDDLEQQLTPVVRLGPVDWSERDEYISDDRGF
jgi:hypothetical protein